MRSGLAIFFDLDAADPVEALYPLIVTDAAQIAPPPDAATGRLYKTGVVGDARGAAVVALLNMAERRSPGTL
nr:hypothetical protein [Bradyrhizobium vignae]